MGSMKKPIILIFTIASLLSAINSDAQVKRKILVEHFTNTYCGICSSRNPGLYTNLDNNPDVLHLAIHPSRPYRICELYLHNATENDERTNFYGLLGSTPRIAIQGDVVSAGANYGSNSIFTNYKDQMSPFDVRVTTVKSDNDSLVAQIVITAQESNSVGSLNLYAPAVEDTIFFSAPNGEDEHYDVFRKVLLNEAITNLPSTVGDSIVLTARTAKHSDWDKNQMYVMAILQDATSKSIEQVGISTPIRATPEVSGISSLLPKGSVRIAPNPFQNSLSISLEADDAYVTITNNLGQVIQRFEMKSRNSSIDLSEIQDGIYTINIQTSKGKTSRKIIKQGS